eukprot:658615-Pelagomonas_calceolata.AAC.2
MQYTIPFDTVLSVNRQAQTAQRGGMQANGIFLSMAIKHANYAVSKPLFTSPGASARCCLMRRVAYS